MTKTAESTSIQDRIYTLWLERQEAVKNKKETVKAHSDNIKRIEDEMKELLEEEDNEVKNSQKSVDE